MTVVTFAREFPEEATFRSLRPDESTRIVDDEVQPPANHFPPEAYLTYFRPVRRRDLQIVRDEIVQTAHNYLYTLIPPGERVVFSIRGATLAQAFTFYEKHKTAVDNHELFGYVRVSGVAFSRVGVRVLIEKKQNVLAWSARPFPRRILKK